MFLRTSLLFAAMAAALQAQDWHRAGGPISNGYPWAVVTDVARQRLVHVDPFGDTWEWDGAEWRKVASGGPTGTIVHDRARGRTLLISGQPMQHREWDGHVWRDVTPPLLPGEAGPAAFDAVRGRVVMVLPSSLATVEYDGVTWSVAGAPGTAPLANGIRDRLVWDSARATVLLLTRGTVTAMTMPLQTYAWNGTSWQLLGTGAAVGDGFDCADDPVRGRVVVHGGLGSGGDTWEWNGTAWTLAQGNGPLQRYWHALAFEPRQAVVMAFGGFAGFYGMHHDAHGWNGSTWTPVGPPSEPPGRRNTAIAHDPLRNRLVLYGGNLEQATVGDLWEWDGARWQLVAALAGPGPREGHAMVFDATAGRTLVFGGSNGGAVMGDFWAWDGGTWTPLTGGPPARRNPGLAWDSIRSRLVLYGGADAAGNQLRDTWEWDGALWTLVTLNGPQLLPAPAFDPISGLTLAIDGTSRTFTWNGAVWQAVSSPRPGLFALCFDPGAGVVTGVGRSTIPAGYFTTWRRTGIGWTAASVTTQPFHGQFDGGAALAGDVVAGRLWLYTSDFLWQLTSSAAAVFEVGNACGSVAGAAPFLSSFGPPRVGDLGYRLDLRAAPQQPAAVCLGTLAPVVLAPGCAWYLAPAACSFTGTDAAGYASTGVPIPPLPALRGLLVYAQGAALDPSPRGFSLTQALLLQLGN